MNLARLEVVALVMAVLGLVIVGLFLSGFGLVW
jgi:hypothetical protein